MKWSNKKNKDYDVIIELLLVFFISVFLFGTLIYDSYESSSSLKSFFELDFFIIIVLLLAISFILYLLDYIVWQLKGYEINELNENYLIIHRKGRLFNRKIKIKTSKIYSINYCKKKSKSFMSSIFRNPLKYEENIGEKDGKIVIQTDKKGWFNINFGSGLTDDEAKHYVKEMIDYIESLKNNRLL